LNRKSAHGAETKEGNIGEITREITMEGDIPEAHKPRTYLDLVCESFMDWTLVGYSH